MDYPENANIIDRQEQQSDYYDRYTCFTKSNVMCAVRTSGKTVVCFAGPKLFSLCLSSTFGIINLNE